MADGIDFDSIVSGVENNSPITEFSKMENILRDFREGHVSMTDLAAGVASPDEALPHLLAINTLAANTADSSQKGLAVNNERAVRFNMRDVRSEQQGTLVEAVWRALDNQDNDNKVRRVAAETLGNIGRYDDRITVDKLTEKRNVESDPKVKDALNKTIGLLNKPFGEE